MIGNAVVNVTLIQKVQLGNKIRPTSFRKDEKFAEVVELDIEKDTVTLLMKLDDVKFPVLIPVDTEVEIEE